MREIKFKAWDGEAMSKPFYPWALMPDMLGGLIDIHGFSVMWTGYGWKWLQFTGLHDKDGKEIYEGYLLKSPVEDIKYFKVSFNNGSFELYHNYGRWGLLSRLYETEFDVEIIGNIYENKNLLS